MFWWDIKTYNIKHHHIPYAANRTIYSPPFACQRSLWTAPRGQLWLWLCHEFKGLLLGWWEKSKLEYSGGKGQLSCFWLYYVHRAISLSSQRIVGNASFDFCPWNCHGKSMGRNSDWNFHVDRSFFHMIKNQKVMVTKYGNIGYWASHQPMNFLQQFFGRT